MGEPALDALRLLVAFFTAAACVVINRMLVHMTLNSFSSKMGALNS